MGMKGLWDVFIFGLLKVFVIVKSVHLLLFEWGFSRLKDGFMIMPAEAIV
jgi:hypothetical protein